MGARSIVTLVFLLLAEAAAAQTDRASADAEVRGVELRADASLALPRVLGALPPQACDPRAAGLAELLNIGVFDGEGVRAQVIISTLTGVEGGQLVAGSGFRWSKGVAARLVLHIPADQAAWRLGKAELVTALGQRQSVRAIEALLPSPDQRVILVTTEAGPEKLRGAFILYLYEASGGPSLVLRSVSFP